MLQYLIKWQGYPESDNTWEPADQVHALDILQEYHKCQPLESIKGEQKPLAKIAIHTITLSELPTIDSQWPSPLPHSQSSSPVTSNMSWSLLLTSLLTLPHTPTLYHSTRSPSLGPSTILRPMPSGMGPSCHALFRTSWQGMRTSPPSSCEPSLWVLPPPSNRGRRSITAGPTISGSTLQTSTLNAAPLSSTSETLTVSHYYASMDLRTTMGGSSPVVLDWAQWFLLPHSSGQLCILYTGDQVC